LPGIAVDRKVGETAMLTKTVDVSEAQAHLKELLSLVLEGAEIVLTEDSTPIARFVPIASPTTLRVAGLHPGAIWTSDDFDEPLPEEFWTGDV
jgi:antitoxin (DNA-binding transcriptional repressor) of toxin-antitoxin stability system